MLVEHNAGSSFADFGNSPGSLPSVNQGRAEPNLVEMIKGLNGARKTLIAASTSETETDKRIEAHNTNRPYPDTSIGENSESIPLELSTEFLRVRDEPKFLGSNNEFLFLHLVKSGGVDIAFGEITEREPRSIFVLCKWDPEEHKYIQKAELQPFEFDGRYVARPTDKGVTWGPENSNVFEVEWECGFVATGIVTRKYLVTTLSGNEEIVPVIPAD